jgi:hypothetical protein
LLHAPAKGESPGRLLYFVVIGLGYILVEITMIQRFVLFLGHPVYALTVVIFLMLLSSGLGSLASHRWLPDARRVWFAIVVITLIVLAYVVVLPVLLRAGIGLAFGIKLALSAVLLVPLGFVMGMPFPTGLRAMAPGSEAIADAEMGAAGDRNRVEWAWALNAASSVLGSVMAMFIAIQWGLRTTLLTAAGCYLVASLLSRSFRPAHLLYTASK